MPTCCTHKSSKQLPTWVQKTGDHMTGITGGPSSKCFPFISNLFSSFPSQPATEFLALERCLLLCPSPFIPAAQQPHLRLDPCHMPIPSPPAERCRENSSGWLHTAVFSNSGAYQLWQLALSNETDFVWFMEMMLYNFLFDILESRGWRISFESWMSSINESVIS